MSRFLNGDTHKQGRASRRSGGLAGRTTEVVLGGAARILVATLIAATAIASWLAARKLRRAGRGPRGTWLGALLHRRGEPIVQAHPAQLSHVREPASPAQIRSGHHEQVQTHSAWSDLGRNLRDAFVTKAGAEFDDLLRSIDRAATFGGRLDALPAGAR